MVAVRSIARYLNTYCISNFFLKSDYYIIGFLYNPIYFVFKSIILRKGPHSFTRKLERFMAHTKKVKILR